MPDEDEESSRNTLLQTKRIYEKKEIQLSVLILTARHVMCALMAYGNVANCGLQIRHCTAFSSLAVAFRTAKCLDYGIPHCSANYTNYSQTRDTVLTVNLCCLIQPRLVFM
jgi:hypothetical protein